MKNYFWGACGIIPAVLLLPSLSHAQKGYQNPSADNFMLEEVVVTARRRAEVQTQVPVSITAYSSDFMQKQNIQSFTDYATKVPNLTFQYGGGGQTGFTEGRQVSIRGISGANTTSFYINDTPVPSAVSPQTINLDRIEVLKGPQGTLFGASSMGGNLRFITRQPSLNENSMSAQLGGGATKSGGTDADLNAGGNLVLIEDKLALQAAAGYTRESGFLTRRFPDGSGGFASKDDQGQTDSWTGSLSLHSALTDRLDATVSILGQSTEIDGLPATFVTLPDYSVDSGSYTFDRDRDVQEFSKDEWTLSSLVFDYGGDGFTVISSTSYFTRKLEELNDSTEGANAFFEEEIGVDVGGPAWVVPTLNHDWHFTQEARVAFDEDLFLPKLSGVVGVFYQRKAMHFSSPAVFVPELAESGLFDDGVLATFNQGQHNTQTAIFGEIYYEVIPDLTLTLGLRKYWIEQELGDEQQDGFLFEGPTVNPGLSNKQSDVVPKVVLSYNIGDRGTVYASASQGFRVGGGQASLPSICDADLDDLGYTPEGIRSYKSDDLWSYEIGAKNNFADGRISVSGAAFQVDWTQIQQDVVLPNCGFSFKANAGKARIRGAEMEVAGQPIADVPLTIHLGVGYEDGVLIDPAFIPQEPNTGLVQTPNWTSTLSGYYEMPISENATVFVAADYSYTGSVKAVDGQGGFVNRQPFNMVNGNVGVRFGETEIRLYARNLLDKRLNYGDLYAAGFERYVDGSRSPQVAVSRPRQIGVQVNMEF